MDIAEIRVELTKRGVTFANNAGLAKLEALLAASVAEPSTALVESEAEAAAAIPEEEIIAKMRAGLTREQAIQVITNQREHDAAQG